MLWGVVQLLIVISPAPFFKPIGLGPKTQHKKGWGTCWSPTVGSQRQRCVHTTIGVRNGSLSVAILEKGEVKKLAK